MLQVNNGSIYEDAPLTSMVTMTTTGDNVTGGSVQGSTSGCLPTYNIGYYSTTPYYWHSYPVYVCHDKTKKAIEVLKALEADGLKVTSVKKFCALVEKIAAIL